MSRAGTPQRPHYVPEAGEIVWLHIDAEAGHEQAGHQSAVVLSPGGYNGRTGLFICCPMTTEIKGYPFEVTLAGARPRAALADQVKSLGWRARRAARKGRVTKAELSEIRAKAISLIAGD